jgi:FkbM family methyltransferase
VADSQIDLLLDGALKLRQAPRGHRVGTDAVLLAAAIAAPKGKAVDLGAGVGAVGLMLARRAPGLDVTLVEIEPQAAALARDNIALNDFSARARVVEADVLSSKARRAAGLADEGYDLVVANPPWLAPGRSRVSPDARRALAHVATRPLADWIKAMAALTKPGGKMALIAPADALRDILDACDGRFGDAAIYPVHPKAAAPAIRLVVTGRKGARAKARLFRGLVLHEDDGRFTPFSEVLHRGRATLAGPAQDVI